MFATPINPSAQLLRLIMMDAYKFPWTLQGFGMFRLYLTEEIRLHIWCPDMAFPEVTTIHNHPWDFESTVLVGSIVNRRYVESTSKIIPNKIVAPWSHMQTKDMIKQKIVCGPGGHATEEKSTVRLTMIDETCIQHGTTYSMTKDEIHESIPTPGCVTMVRRRFHPDREHAYVYHDPDKSWVSAEPRRANIDEIRKMIVTVVHALPVGFPAPRFQ